MAGAINDYVTVVEVKRQFVALIMLRPDLQIHLGNNPDWQAIRDEAVDNLQAVWWPNKIDKDQALDLLQEWVQLWLLNKHAEKTPNS